LGDEYLFGPDLLVAPVVDEGSTERAVYLPAGGWVDFWTDTVYSEPGAVTVSAPLDTLPLFVRQGAMLPLGPEMQHVGERPVDPLTLEIYRGPEQLDCRLTLYEDDGETTQYRTGAYMQTSFQLAAQADGFTLGIGKAQGQFSQQASERGYIVNLHHQAAVHGVLCNGAPVSFLDAAHSLELVPHGWQWNATTRVLTIKLPRTAEAVNVHVLSS
jgi:alpha-glucosidase (family GH31 glycosyl hydrolase)